MWQNKSSLVLSLLQQKFSTHPRTVSLCELWGPAPAKGPRRSVTISILSNRWMDSGTSCGNCGDCGPFRPLVAESWSACTTPTWVDTYGRASLCGSPHFQRSSGTALEEKKERVCTYWSEVEEQCHFPSITSPLRQHNLGRNKTAHDVVP